MTINIISLALMILIQVVCLVIISITNYDSNNEKERFKKSFDFLFNSIIKYLSKLSSNIAKEFKEQT